MKGKRFLENMIQTINRGTESGKVWHYNRLCEAMVGRLICLLRGKTQIFLNQPGAVPCH